MGLAGPRKRRKLGQDPNNTTWARSSDSFGAKILSAQGWTPGSFLGPEDAPQAEHYSAANASHIRVALKDNNLGLGARPGNSDGDNFGSGIFSDILGRLNGKSEKQVEEEQQERADLGRKLYAEQKYGATRFVRGGFLVGDRIENARQEKESKEDVGATPIAISASANVVSAAKKSEVDSVSGMENPVSSGGTSRIQKPQNKVKGKESKKSKKRSRRIGTLQDEPNMPTLPNAESSGGASVISSAEADQISENRDSERQQLRLEKQARKEARRQKKADRRDTTLSTPSGSGKMDTMPTPTIVRMNEEVIQEEEEDLIPHTRSVPRVVPGSRHHVRQKYIQQKRMASMDPRSLSEILMVKF